LPAFSVTRISWEQFHEFSFVDIPHVLSVAARAQPVNKNMKNTETIIPYTIDLFAIIRSLS
jgi:hypothetical protein